jgi:hypothetical protein
MAFSRESDWLNPAPTYTVETQGMGSLALVSNILENARYIFNLDD